MFAPLKLLKELWSNRMYVARKESAVEYFDMQVSSVKNIKGTQGYQEIKLYWARVWEAALIRLEEIESNNVADWKAAQAEMKVARRFLDFLEVMETTQPPEKDTDV